MASNSFGNIFKITTWGESHGPAVGVVIDGCPAGLALSMDDINAALALRAPGRNAYTSPRKEPDLAQIASGVFEGKTTGSPISIIIPNLDVDSSKYEPIKDLLRPGHANYTYVQKYGVFDYRGGGRSSARETACRVAAGCVAEKILTHFGIKIFSYLHTMGDIAIDRTQIDFTKIKILPESPLFCPDSASEQRMMQFIETLKQAGDSIGGIVEFQVHALPVGLGDPIYEKLEANLAKAMMSMPASKGFEMGEGFSAVSMRGSKHNDPFTQASGLVSQSNHAGGTLGGISTGMPLIGRVAFKPTSSIQHAQATVDFDGNPQTFNLPKGSRHDPCVAIRAVPVVLAMCQLVLADAILMNQIANIERCNG